MHAEVVGRTNIFASFGLPIIATTFHDPVFPNMPSLTRNSHDLGEFILGIFIIIPCTTMHLIVRRCVYVSYREFLEHLGGIPGTPDSPFIHLCISITITTIPELPKKMPNCRLVHCHHIRSNIDHYCIHPRLPGVLESYSPHQYEIIVESGGQSKLWIAKYHENYCLVVRGSNPKLGGSLHPFGALQRGSSPKP